jgi:hypothetical protein
MRKLESNEIAAISGGLMGSDDVTQFGWAEILKKAAEAIVGGVLGNLTYDTLVNLVNRNSAGTGTPNTSTDWPGQGNNGTIPLGTPIGRGAVPGP